MNDALYQLYVSRQVNADECVRVSSDPSEFVRMSGVGGQVENVPLAPPANRGNERAATGGLGRR